MMEEESIQSKRQEIWTRMYQTLDLNPGSPVRGGRGRVLMAIRPSVSVDRLLTEPTIRAATVTLTASTVIFFTVPDDETWILHAYQADRGGGDRDITGMILGAPQRLGGGVIFVHEIAAASSERFTFGHGIPVHAGWTVRLAGTGGTTNGDWTLNLFMEVSTSWLT